MKIYGKKLSLKQLILLAIYYCILQYLPSSNAPLIGKFIKKLRYHCCKHIFKFCGKNVNIERKAFFGSGVDLCIDENSGLGKNCFVPNDIIIGKNVMIGPNCYIFSANHSFDRSDIPIIKQGYSQKKKTVIEDDVWIGRDVYFTPGRTVKRGSIVAAACVLCKDFPEYSIIGGNPSRLIKTRL